MLMPPHRGAVDHLHIAVVSLGDCGYAAGPDPGFAPPHEAVVAGCARTEFLRQRPPRRARSQYPENPVQHPAIIDSWNPARFVRQQRRDHSPFEIRQLVSPHVQNLPQLGSLNQKPASVGIPFMSSRPKATRALPKIVAFRDWLLGEVAADRQRLAALAGGTSASRAKAGSD